MTCFSEAVAIPASVNSFFSASVNFSVLVVGWHDDRILDPTAAAKVVRKGGRSARLGQPAAYGHSGC
jgi:hypothetical protein